MSDQAELLIPEPISAGLFLTYHCNGNCRHCMYACGSSWPADWIEIDLAEEILGLLSGKIKGAPFGERKIGINYGLHFTGGEPFLNFELLLRLTKIAKRYGIPSLFVETSCSWCTDVELIKRRLIELRQAGLDGILFSVNPFILERVPFERTKRAVIVGREIFGENAIIYQEFFHNLFLALDIHETVPFQDFLKMAGSVLNYMELIPMGRAVYQLDSLFTKQPIDVFLRLSCRKEITRDWHIHIDNYGNYIPGFCGGISLGQAVDILSGRPIDLNERRVIKSLVMKMDDLYRLGQDYGYMAKEDGYISKCHLCLDIRRYLFSRGEFKELRPAGFYNTIFRLQNVEGG